MELQFQKSEIRTIENVVSDVKQLELTQEIRLSDGMPDIGRVLTAWGQVQIRSKEWNRDEIQVSGGVTVGVLYLPEDGTEPRCAECWMPFQMKWELEPGREGIIRFLPRLRFVDGRGVSARKIMVRAGVGGEVQAMRRSETESFAPAEVPENVELLRRTWPVRIPKEAGERVFLLDEDLSLPDTLPLPEKLLSYMLSPMVTEAKVMADKLVFRGKGNLHLVYRCPEGKVRSADLEVPFSQFAELDGRYSPEAAADLWPAVTNLELDTPENGKLRLKAGLVGQYLIDDREIIEVVEDAYSPFRDTHPQLGELKLPSVLDSRREQITAEQTIPDQTGQIADVVFFSDFPRQRRENGAVEMEFPGLFQVLYYGPDGALQSANARWEGNYSINAAEKAPVRSSVELRGWPVGTAEDQIRLTAPLHLAFETSADTQIPMVTGLDLGEHREPDPGRPSLILCRPEGEELWEIAKRCGSTVEAIRKANDLQTDALPERMLLIPVS